MLKYLFFTTILLCTQILASGQYYFYDDKYMDNDILFEAGITTGLMMGVTDVGQKKGSALSFGYYDWKSIKPNVGLYGAVMYKSIVEGRIQLTRGTISGTDANSNTNSVKNRNLSYSSSITELSLTGSFHPVMLLDLEYLPAVSPYLTAGIGIFSFNPTTVYKGEVIKLRRMNTEGQNSAEFPARKQYSMRAVSIPLGGGLKYELSGIYNIRIEALYRMTTGDYLDDVSLTYPKQTTFDDPTQRILSHRYLEINPRARDRKGARRGTGTYNDRFFSFNVNFGYVIGREKRKMGRTR